VPAVYVPMYVEAQREFRVNRFLLASIHAQETDFGRLRAPGVTSGVNAYGCCAGPMQFNLSDTWDGVKLAYRRGRRPAGDYPQRATSHPSVYDPFDAIMAAGLKLSRQGAGLALASAGTRRAVFAYNHADWYVDAVLSRAARWQREAAALTDLGAAPGVPGGVRRVPARRPWIGAVPGFPGESCDRRILPDLLYLARRYRLHVTDCYATSGHAADGEHPLGLGVDLVPAARGSWDLIDRLARYAEPAQNRPRAPWRWVGYDGDANHGRGHHLHLSWDHAPAAFNTQAAWVLVFTGGAA
jgi:hypothetical protein